MRVRVALCASSLEAPFLRRLLQECGKFAEAVALAHGDRLFDGTPEDATLFRDLAADFPAVLFVRSEVPVAGAKDGADAVRLHNAARRAALAALDGVPASGPDIEDVEWVLFLDGDEVPDGQRVSEWIADRGSAAAADEAFKMANFWYFLSPTLRAEAFEDSVVLIARRAITDAGLSHPRERDGLLACARSVRTVHRMERGGEDRSPLFHHYSWVRGREQLLRKVQRWGHAGQRPWAQLLRDAWRLMDEQKTPPERDFVHGYKLNRLAPAQDFLAAKEF